MLVDDIINQSIEELKEEETEKNKLLSITEVVTNDSFTETPIKELRRSKWIAEQKTNENHIINRYGRKLKSKKQAKNYWLMQTVYFIQLKKLIKHF